MKLIEGDLGNFREGDYLISFQTQFLKKAILHLCSKNIKKNVISFIEALAPPDSILKSPIGNSDGKAYEVLLFFFYSQTQHLWTAVTSAPSCFERPDWWPLLKEPLVPKASL